MQETRLAGLPISSARAQRRAYQLGKRTLDCIVALLILLAAGPAMALIAVWITLDSRGPVFFRQTRVGMHGRSFRVYKFRTMYHEADQEIHRRYVQALIRPGDAAGTGAPAGKLEEDPRITRAGRFLRRTSLDELPQLFNVVRGDMSMVGPRPPIPYEVEEYESWHLERLTVLPGITGWWQVYGRSRVSFDDMVRMDLTYIANQSLWLDVKLMLLTLPAILSGRGAK